MSYAWSRRHIATVTELPRAGPPSLYSNGHNPENKMYMSPAAETHFGSGSSRIGRELYRYIHNRMQTEQARSIYLTDQGQMFIASAINAHDGKDVIRISSMFEFPIPDARTLAELFGLSPAETRLAQHIAHGGSLDEFAATAQIKISTARSQLAAIFSKTGRSGSRNWLLFCVGLHIFRVRTFRHHSDFTTSLSAA
jgi:DNA-binding CsgD family transcriptional regulator